MSGGVAPRGCPFGSVPLGVRRTARFGKPPALREASGALESRRCPGKPPAPWKGSGPLERRRCPGKAPAPWKGSGPPGRLRRPGKAPAPWKGSGPLERLRCPGKAPAPWKGSGPLERLPGRPGTPRAAAPGLAAARRRCRGRACPVRPRGAAMAERDGPGGAGRPAGGGKMALHRCETCSKEAAKYRCPRCMKYSCSLLCVKKHKLALSCNGVRDKTAFVSVNEFTDLNLLSDYRFLEDVGRTADAAARRCIVHSPATKRLLYCLRNKARGRNIELKTLPIGFTKRRENSTTFNSVENKFYWHLKLIFPHCHAEYTLKGVPDDKTLADILKPYIDPVESDPVVCQRLKIYTASPQSDVRILMKIENRNRNSIRYNELDASRSLLDNLKGKVIIEYPTLFVVLKTMKNDMVVLGQEGSEPAENSDSESSSLSSVEEGEIRDSS
ncbi:box C/D snoRNA protein 1 [Hirundo rustica]|uniref:box C/D snoRNA protein 1 n=1 Tax=Hirundo rustica TaxID=43150 RepID=UPI001A940A8F|nr:box C/D snoRNA protein 1 [Hirundo rustica]